jgi:hypothetical protein
MSVLKLIAAIGLTGLSLASCVDGDSYGGGGYGSSVYGGGVYLGGYDGYYGGYGGPYPYYGRYDRYSGRRWDNHRDDYRRGNRDWQGQRHDRDTSGPRPERQTYRTPTRNYNAAPYSPSSCGSLDCNGMSSRGSNR